jgi:hypothetical protein
MGMEPPVTREIVVPGHLGSAADQARSQRIQIRHQDAWVRFAGWPEVVFDAKVNFQTVTAHPQAAAHRQDRRFPHFR